jgi:hypothetical protein
MGRLVGSAVRVICAGVVPRLGLADNHPSIAPIYRTEMSKSTFGMPAEEETEAVSVTRAVEPAGADILIAVG